MLVDSVKRISVNKDKKYHINMSLGSLSVADIFINISNAFVGTLADIGGRGDEDVEHDAVLRTLMKENRYMYLALLVLLLLIVGNVIYTSE